MISSGLQPAVRAPLMWTLSCCGGYRKAVRAAIVASSADLRSNEDRFGRFAAVLMWVREGGQQDGAPSRGDRMSKLRQERSWVGLPWNCEIMT